MLFKKSLTVTNTEAFKSTLISVINKSKIALIAAVVVVGFTSCSHTHDERVSGKPTSGDPILKYDWEESVTKATIGPEAIKSVSEAAGLSSGPKGKGLFAGKEGGDINLTIPGKVLDIDGINFSVDFQRDEDIAYFITRGNSLSFGFVNGYLRSSMRICDGKGKYFEVNSPNIMEIEDDDQFRNYQLNYDPNTGITQVFVDGLLIWSHVNAPAPIYWKGAKEVVIGDWMNGDGLGNTLMDNLLVESIKFTGTMDEQLASGENVGE